MPTLHCMASDNYSGTGVPDSLQLRYQHLTGGVECIYPYQSLNLYQLIVLVLAGLKRYMYGCVELMKSFGG